jgi:hypothetical protein
MMGCSIVEEEENIRVGLTLDHHPSGVSGGIVALRLALRSRE